MKFDRFKKPKYLLPEVVTQGKLIYVNWDFIPEIQNLREEIKDVRKKRRKDQ